MSTSKTSSKAAPKAPDARNMTRSTVVRLLQREVSVDQSITKGRRIHDDWTRGWKLHWTNSPYSEVHVTWENGSLPSVRHALTEERDRLRAACLDEVQEVLRRNGYLTKREDRCVLILRRTERPATETGTEAP